MDEEILLNNQVIKYRDHIRKIVEASTVYERNMYDRRFKAVVIFKKGTAPDNYSNYKGVLFFFGILVGMAITLFTFFI